MKISFVLVAVASSLVAIVACSSSSSTGGGTSTDSGAAANDSGASTASDSGTGGGGGDNPLSCEDDSSDNCVFYASVPKGSELSNCPAPAAIVKVCPTTNVVATCAYNSGGTDQLLTWYKGVSANNATLKMTCDSLSGTFTAS